MTTTPALRPTPDFVPPSSLPRDPADRARCHRTCLLDVLFLTTDCAELRPYGEQALAALRAETPLLCAELDDVLAAAVAGDEPNALLLVILLAFHNTHAIHQLILSRTHPGRRWAVEAAFLRLLESRIPTFIESATELGRPTNELRSVRYRTVDQFVTHLRLFFLKL